MVKKLLSMLLGVTLAAVMLAGCGSTPENGGGDRTRRGGSGDRRNCRR